MRLDIISLGQWRLPLQTKLYNWPGKELERSAELRSCVKIEVDVLGSPSIIVLMVSECGRKATLNLNWRGQFDSPSRPDRPCEQARRTSVNSCLEIGIFLSLMNFLLLIT